MNPQKVIRLDDVNTVTMPTLPSCPQVGKLYILYQLEVVDSEEPVVELVDVICLLKDEKELYIQKDHLSAKLDICRCVWKEMPTLPNRCTSPHQYKHIDIHNIPTSDNVFTYNCIFPNNYTQTDTMLIPVLCICLG